MISNIALSAILGIVTLVTFGTERFLNAAGGQSLGDIPAFVMGVVALTVGVGTFRSSIQGHDINNSVLIALGPVGGFMLYLIGYHLVLPPSTDSPTWLIFLAFAGGFMTLGAVAHLIGLLFKNES